MRKSIYNNTMPEKICNNIGTFLVNSMYQYAILLANQFFDNLIIPRVTPKIVAKIIPKTATNPVFKSLQYLLLGDYLYCYNRLNTD